MPSFVPNQTYVPRTQQPGQNLPVSGATGPGVQAGTGAQPPNTRPRYTYDAQGNRIVSYEQTPPATGGGAQAPTSGATGTGSLSNNPGPAVPVIPGNTGGTPAQDPQNPRRPIDPVDVVTGRPTLDSFREYQDAAYAEAQRRLDPQWQASERQFEQQMINRGIPIGSRAYEQARAMFDRSKTDAYSSAQNNALASGLRAQQQAFGQNLSESELANRLLIARENNAQSGNNANASIQAQLNAAEIGRLNFLDQLGLNREQMNLGASQWDRQFGFGQQQWADQFGMQQGAQDFGQMMQMLGFDRDTAWGNNTQNNQQFQQLMSLFAAGMPQAQGVAPVDYLGALGMNQNQQNQNYQTGVNQANQNNANWLALAGYFLCDEELKTVTGPADSERCLEIAREIPLAQFSYTAEGSQAAGVDQETEFVGTMAQPFNRALHGSPDPYIRIMDAFGVLLGSVKALADRFDGFEQRIAALEAADELP